MFILNTAPTTAIYTLSLHDALPIYDPALAAEPGAVAALAAGDHGRDAELRDQAPVLVVVAQLGIDRKSTRLNSSHRTISYAVFCLKKKIHLSIELQGRSTLDERMWG